MAEANPENTASPGMDDVVEVYPSGIARHRFWLMLAIPLAGVVLLLVVPIHRGAAHADDVDLLKAVEIGVWVLLFVFAAITVALAVRCRNKPVLRVAWLRSRDELVIERPQHAFVGKREVRRASALTGAGTIDRPVSVATPGVGLGGTVTVAGRLAACFGRDDEVIVEADYAGDLSPVAALLQRVIDHNQAAVDGWEPKDPPPMLSAAYTASMVRRRRRWIIIIAVLLAVPMIFAVARWLWTALSALANLVAG